MIDRCIRIASSITSECMELRPQLSPGKVPENIRSGLRSGCVLVAFCLRSAPFLRSRVLDFAFCPLAFCPCVLGGPCVLGLAFWAPCVLCLLDLAFWVAWRSGSCVLGCLAFCLRSALAFWGLAFCLRSRVLPCVLPAFLRSACVLLFCLRSGVLPYWCRRWSSDARASTIWGFSF